MEDPCSLQIESEFNRGLPNHLLAKTTFFGLKYYLTSEIWLGCVHSITNLGSEP
jgi:hypothetical protein